MGNDENFDFLGLPDNDAFDIPDPVKKKKKQDGPGFMIGGPFNIDPEMLNQLKNISPEELKANLPPDLYQSLESIAKMVGADMSTLLSDMADQAQQVLQGKGGSSMEEPEEDMRSARYDSTGNLRFLDPAKFGTIKCDRDPDFHNNLFTYIGGDTKNLLNAVSTVEVDDITKQLPLTDVKDFKYIGSSDTHDIFFAEMNNPNQYGFFVSVCRNESGQYVLLVPEFRNTFWIDVDNAPHLYNLDKDNPDNDLDAFSEDQLTKELIFDGYSPDIIDFATRFHLAPNDKNHIITATEFGTIKNVMPVIPKSNTILKIGNIMPFDTDKAKTFIEDANLNVSDAPYSLYMNFGTMIEKESLGEMAQILFKVDLNNCPLIQNSELHYTSDGIIYINVDLGQF